MSHLSAVVALAPIPALGTIPGEMAIPVAVEALDVLAPSTTTTPRSVAFSGDLHTSRTAGDFSTVQVVHGILSIPGVFHVHKGKTRRIVGNPDVVDSAKLVKGIFDVLLVRVLVQVANVDTSAGITTSPPTHDL